MDIRQRRTPAQRRSRATVASILDAAAQLFARHGYHRATTNRIAERAGVSVGSLYEYFSSKDAILVALGEAHLADGRRVLREAVGRLERAPTDLGGTIRAIVGATVRVHAIAPKLHQVFYEEGLRSSRMRALTQAVERRAMGWWERYLRSLRDIVITDPALAAAMIVETIDAMVHKVVIQGDGSIPTDRYVEEIAAFVEGYLRLQR